MDDNARASMRRYERPWWEALLADLGELFAFVKVHGDANEFPTPVTIAFELRGLMARQQVLKLKVMKPYLRDLRRFVTDLRLQCEVRQLEWPHLEECAALCTRILDFVPDLDRS